MGYDSIGGSHLLNQSIIADSKDLGGLVTEKHLIATMG